MRTCFMATLVLALALSGCGGGGTSPFPAAAAATNGSEATQSTNQQTEPTGSNELALVVDSGPLLMFFEGRPAINTPYANVTLCSPGSAAACQTIDHVLVDTGSVGLRVLASALTGVAAPVSVLEPASGAPLRECVQFADGYSWGSVGTVDVRIGGRTIASVSVNVVGDPAAGVAPASCVSGPAKNSMASFGANGVLGVGGFVRDCGASCAAGRVSGWYYTCPSAGSADLCHPAPVPLERQVSNPIALLDSDNNGVTIALPTVPARGAARVNGSLYFGVGTQANNAAGAARFFSLDSHGTLLTAFGGATQYAVIDSGSNGYFFSSPAISTCSKYKAFYCPTQSGAPVSLAQSAQILDRSGVSQSVAFTVDNVDQLFAGQSALPGLAAPSSEFVGGATGVFAWGLPFFYGRTVHLLFEGSSAGLAVGPAVGF
jgi:predicted small lipoprotein YifL